MAVSNEQIAESLSVFALSDESRKEALIQEVKRLLDAHTRDQETALKQALDALHRVGSALNVRKLLGQDRRRTEPLQRSLEEKALSDDEIEDFAFQTWEEIVLKVRMEGTTVFDCFPDDIPG